MRVEESCNQFRLGWKKSWPVSFSCAGWATWPLFVKKWPSWAWFNSR